MAALAIPAIIAAAPLVENAIVSLIAALTHKTAPLVEAARGAGTGPVKFADLFVSVMSDLALAHSKGQISMVPDDATAKLIIQSVLSSMKLLGLLDGQVSPTAPTPAGPLAATGGRISLAAGQSITIMAPALFTGGGL